MEDEKKLTDSPALPGKGKKKKKGFFARMAAKKLEWFVFFICLALTVVLLWPYCTVTVEAGHTGVYFSRLFGGTLQDKPREEGLRFKLPWDFIIPYDSRKQSRDYDIIVLARGGLSVKVEMSVIWYVPQEMAGSLHYRIGPDYIERIINPAVVGSVRSVIGSIEQGRLYDGDPMELQIDVMRLLSETVVEAPFKIHAIVIRKVELPAKMADAISEKFVAEQNVLAERYRVLSAGERYKRQYIDAEAVRVAQSIVNEGMSEAYLRFRGIEATLELAQSDNAKLVIIGDKDGMPLILNPGTMEKSPTLPSGMSRGQYGMDGSRRNNAIATFDSIQTNLGLANQLMGDLINRFPTVDQGIRDSRLPQATDIVSTNNVNSKPDTLKKED